MNNFTIPKKRVKKKYPSDENQMLFSKTVNNIEKRLTEIHKTVSKRISRKLDTYERAVKRYQERWQRSKKMIKALELSLKKLKSEHRGTQERYLCRHPSTWTKELSNVTHWCNRCGAIRFLHKENLKWLPWQLPNNYVVLKTGEKGPFRRKK